MGLSRLDRPYHQVYTFIIGCLDVLSLPPNTTTQRHDPMPSSKTVIQRPVYKTVTQRHHPTPSRSALGRHCCILILETVLIGPGFLHSRPNQLQRMLSLLQLLQYWPNGGHRPSLVVQLIRTCFRVIAEDTGVDKRIQSKGLHQQIETRWIIILCRLGLLRWMLPTLQYPCFQIWTRRQGLLKPTVQTHSRIFFHSRNWRDLFIS
jgi:hypothetical protein